MVYVAMFNLIKTTWRDENAKITYQSKQTFLFEQGSASTPPISLNEQPSEFFNTIFRIFSIAFPVSTVALIHYRGTLVHFTDGLHILCGYLADICASQITKDDMTCENFARVVRTYCVFYR